MFSNHILEINHIWIIYFVKKGESLQGISFFFTKKHYFSPTPELGKKNDFRKNAQFRTKY